VTDSDKHSSLLPYRIDYSRKSFLKEFLVVNFIERRE
jgi:hypothetical protein